MTNPHCLPPVPFGKEQPDGSVVLDKAEAVWLRTVFSRIDTTQADVAEAQFDGDSVIPELREYSKRHMAHGIAKAVEEIIDFEEFPQTREDKMRHVVRLRGKLTIIRGGLPPRAGF